MLFADLLSLVGNYMPNCAEDTRLRDFCGGLLSLEDCVFHNLTTGELVAKDNILNLQDFVDQEVTLTGG